MFDVEKLYIYIDFVDVVMDNLMNIVLDIQLFIKITIINIYTNKNILKNISLTNILNINLTYKMHINNIEQLLNNDDHDLLTY